MHESLKNDERQFKEREIAVREKRERKGKKERREKKGKKGRKKGGNWSFSQRSCEKPKSQSAKA